MDIRSAVDFLIFVDPNSPGFPSPTDSPWFPKSPGEDFDPKGAFGEKLGALLLQSQEMMKILEAGLQHGMIPFGYD